MGDRANGTSSGYDENMKSVVDPPQAEAMVTDGKEQESYILATIPSAPNAGLQCLRPKWTTGSRTRAT
jgi:hypothetical protein